MIPQPEIGGWSLLNALGGGPGDVPQFVEP